MAKLDERKRKSVIKCRAENPDWAQRRIAEACGVSTGTVFNILGKEDRQRGITEEQTEISGDLCTISLPKTRICTLEQLVAHCKIDLSVWEVERFIANKWEMGYKDALSKANVIPLFQIKATLRKKVHVVSARKEIDDLKELAKKHAHKPPSIKRLPNNSGNMLELNIPDLHVGKLAWSPETGGGNYDSQIAVDRYRAARDSLLERVGLYKFDEILFIVGNDLFHSDSAAGATTSGTKLDTDSRYPKSFVMSRTLIIESIEVLRKIAPVKVVMVPGNHDSLSVWHLGDSLECYFHKYSDVTIDNTPRTRKYHQFGDVMLMWVHGHKSKRLDYPLLMATEERRMFGATRFHEVHTGHLHTTKTEEKNGVRVRVLPALCEPDAWHSENHFVGNLMSAEAYRWHRKEGLMGIDIYTIPD